MSNENRDKFGHFVENYYDGRDCPHGITYANFDIIASETRAHIDRVGKIYRLKEEERNAIHRYVNTYNDNWYIKINKALRGDEQLGQIDEEICKHLDSALDKLPKYNGNLLRTIDIPQEDLTEFLVKCEVGKAIDFPAYTSTTKSETPQMKGNIHFIILGARNATDLEEFNPTQKEVLYKRGAKFKVINFVNYNEKYSIYLKEKDNG